MSVKPHIHDFEAIVAARTRGVGELPVIPGCWDAFSARLAAEAKVSALSLSPNIVAMARHGRVSDDLVTFGEMASIATSIREEVDLPLIMQAQGGYGNALNVIRTVKLFERAGASAIEISDAVTPGSFQEGAGNVTIRPADMIGKLKAAVDARTDALIITRTCAVGSEGMAAALERLEAYLEAGADLILVAHDSDRTLAHQLATHFAGRVPLIYDFSFKRDHAMMSTPIRAMGYALALHPLGLLDAVTHNVPRLLADITLPRRVRSVEVTALKKPIDASPVG